MTNEKKTEEKENPTPSEEETGIVKIDKNQFNRLLEDMEEMKKTNEMLMETADKRAVARYHSRHQTKLPKTVKIRILPIEEKGKLIRKVIMGWRTVKDEVYKVPGTMNWREDQVIELIFEDGTKKEISLLDFNRVYEHIICKRIGVIEDEGTGLVSFKLIREDNGKEITIGSAYVN